MALYMSFVKYSPQGAAAVHKDGLVSRRKVLEDYVSGLGGKIVNMYAVSDGEWDYVAIMESDSFTNQKLAAHGLLVYGAGAVERIRYYDLATLEEADEARNSLPGYQPPST